MQALLTSAHFGAWILPALLFVPLVGALLIRVLGRSAAPGRALEAAPWREVRVLAAATLGVEAILATGLWLWIPTDAVGWQAVVDVPWISDWGARFTVGVDAVSAVMILLTAWLMFLTLLGSWTAVQEKLRTYYSLLMIFTAGCVGVFVAVDLLLFYVMWEVLLIPLYFVIGIWGGKERVGSSFKFFTLTMASSLFMLVAIGAVWMSAGTHSFNIDTLSTSLDLTLRAQLWLFAAFFIAFAVKSAMWPFHFWLPDAQHEAPTTAAVALGIKVGAYGLYRFALPLFPAAAMEPTVRAVIMTLAVVGIIYGALVALVQPDFKRLVSYAAVSHAGFVLLGLFANTVQGVQGAVMVMISSGITNAALFLLLGILHQQRGTGMIANFGGIARVVPIFAVMLSLVSFSSIGLPGTGGFVGEFLVLIGTYKASPVAAVLAASGVVFAAVYFLWAVQRVLFQKVTNEKNLQLQDLNGRERLVMAVFATAILWLGIAPRGVLSAIEPSAKRLVEQVERGASAVAPRPIGTN